MKFLLPFLVCLTCSAERVPFFNGGGYEREEQMNPAWWVTNNLSPSVLYRYGAYVSEETGTNDLNLLAAWQVQSYGVPVGVVDSGPHGDRVIATLAQAAPLTPIYSHSLLRWYANTLAVGIADCVAHGCKIVNVSGSVVASSDTLDELRLTVSNPGVLVVWAARADTTGNMDADLVEYPYRWNLPNVLYVNSTDRNGQWYPSAVGTNCVAAPGRNIVAAGTYSSGCSYSAPIAAGVASLVWQRYPWLTAAQLATWLRNTAAPTGPVRRVNPVAALQPPVFLMPATEEGDEVKR